MFSINSHSNYLVMVNYIQQCTLKFFFIGWTVLHAEVYKSPCTFHCKIFRIIIDGLFPSAITNKFLSKYIFRAAIAKTIPQTELELWNSVSKWHLLVKLSILQRSCHRIVTDNNSLSIAHRMSHESTSFNGNNLKARRTSLY